MIPPPRLAVNGVENALRERIKVARKKSPTINLRIFAR